MEVVHDTIVEERVAEASPDAVIAAFTDRRTRPEWAVPAGEVLRIDQLDLRTGGFDRYECGPPDGPGITVSVEHLAVHSPHLVVDRETAVGPDGALLATSLVTWELTSVPAGVRIRETVQAVSLAGSGMIDGTREGTALVLDRLVAHLQR